MQQTETYKLNLIETSDPFSPNPLNENAEKTEAALSAKANAADHAALDARVTVLEAHRLTVGTYVGNGEKAGDSQFIGLDFTPVAVIVSHVVVTHLMCVTDAPSDVLEIVPGGFNARKAVNPYSSSTANDKGITYHYLAIC